MIHTLLVANPDGQAVANVRLWDGKGMLLHDDTHPIPELPKVIERLTERIVDSMLGEIREKERK